MGYFSANQQLKRRMVNCVNILYFINPPSPHPPTPAVQHPAYVRDLTKVYIFSKVSISRNANVSALHPI